VIASWQLSPRRQSESAGDVAIELKRLAYFALIGLGLAVVGGVGYPFLWKQTVRDLVFGAFALPYTIALIVGLIIQVVAWVMRISRNGERGLLVAATLGWGVSLIACCVVREAVRIGSIAMETTMPNHLEASSIEGFPLFVIAALINFGLIGFCIWIVRKSLRAA